MYRSDSVHCTKYDGSGHQLILTSHEYLSHPFSLTVFEHYIYWTDWRLNGVIRVRQGDGGRILNKYVLKYKILSLFHSLKFVTLQNFKKYYNLHEFMLHLAQACWSHSILYLIQVNVAYDTNLSQLILVLVNNFVITIKVDFMLCATWYWSLYLKEKKFYILSSAKDCWYDYQAVLMCTGKQVQWLGDRSFAKNIHTAIWHQSLSSFSAAKR